MDAAIRIAIDKAIDNNNGNVALAVVAELNAVGFAIVDCDLMVDVRHLVTLWTNPKIQSLPRSERNAAIEDTRARIIAAMTRRDDTGGG